MTNLQQREAKAFFWAHSIMLCVVLAGFARSFYLRGLFLDHALPLLHQLHGLLLTLWFVLTVTQARLAQTGHTSKHRQLAWTAIPVVAGVVISGAWVNTALALRLTSAQDPENMFIWANYMSLLSFVALVCLAVRARRRLTVHRRLMLFASIAIIGPAFARFAFWPVLGLGLAMAPALAGVGMLLLIAIALSYDLFAWRRVQAATIAGFLSILMPLLAGTGVALSGLGFALMQRLQG